MIALAIENPWFSRRATPARVDRDGGLLEALRQLRELGGEFVGVVHHVRHGEAWQLPLQVQSQPQEGGREVVALVGGLVPDQALEAAGLIAISQLQGAGGASLLHDATALLEEWQR